MLVQMDPVILLSTSCEFVSSLFFCFHEVGGSLAVVHMWLLKANRRCLFLEGLWRPFLFAVQWTRHLLIIGLQAKRPPCFLPTKRKEDFSPSGASAKCLAVIRQFETVPGYLEMAIHGLGLGNMVAFFPQIVLLAGSLAPLAYIYGLALDHQDNLKQSHICERAEQNWTMSKCWHMALVTWWLSFLRLSLLAV